MLTGQIYTDETLLADHVVCVFTLRHVACRGLLHTFRQTREARCKYAANTVKSFNAFPGSFLLLCLCLFIYLRILFRYVYLHIYIPDV